MTRIGALGYLNARPLIAGLERDPTVTLRFAAPSRLADELRAGALDLALAPQVEAEQDDDYRIVPGLCIAADGNVESILVFLRRPWPDVSRIGVDISSRTSVDLLRVLCHRQGKRVEMVPVEPGLDLLRGGTPAVDAVLLIGDHALAADRGEFPRLDLGGLWKEETGLPFVYAVWLGRRDAPRVALTAVRRAASDGLARRRELAADFCRANPHVLAPAAAERYLTDVIRYELGARELESMRLFHGLRRAAAIARAREWTPRFFGESAAASA